MGELEHPEDPQLLWSAGAVTCECLHLAPNQIEIRLSDHGTPIEREVFRTSDAASDFAIAKMHTYRGS